MRVHTVFVVHPDESNNMKSPLMKIAINEKK